jgi:hypothetical protein
VVSCVCVGLEAHIRHEHQCNRSCIDTVGLRLSETEAFPVKVGVQGVNDKAVQAVVKQKPENVVAVVSGCLKSYFYSVLSGRASLDPLQQAVETCHIVRDGKDIRKDYPFRADDEAVVLVLGDIDSYANHRKTSNGIFDAVSTGRFALVTLFQINRLAVSN